MRIIRSLIGPTIVLAFALLASSSAAASVRPFEVQSYSTDMGLSMAVAEEHLEIQKDGAGIVDQLQETQGDSYAGVWFDSQSGEFVVPTLGGQGAVAAALKGASLGGDFRTVPAQSSWEELETAQGRINKVLMPLIKDGLVQTSLDPSTNSVVITEAQGVDPAAHTSIARAAAAQGASVEMRQAASDNLQINLEACKAAPYSICDLPIRGGVRIQPAGTLFASTGGCTAGFKGIGDVFGNRFILTAGHCYAHGAAEWTSYTPDEAKRYLGFVQAANYPGQDNAAINANGTYWDNPWGPNIIANWGVNQEFPISYESSSYLGEGAVCHIGSLSGKSCGTVVGLNISSGDQWGGVLNHLTKFQITCAIDGDSGGPVFSGNVALGLYSGSDALGTEEEYCNHASYYTEITEDTDSLGVHVAPRIGAPPVAETTSATNVQARGATFNGSLDPNGADTSYHFDYGPTSGYGSSTGSAGGGSAWGPGPVSMSVSGLLPAENYHYRLVASNAYGTSTGSDSSFTTPPVPPAVTAQPATGISGTGATLNATINPEGSATSYFFEYGTSPSFGSKTAEASVGSGRTASAVSAPLSGLEFGANYYFRAVAHSVGGTTTGPTLTFTPGWSATPISLPSPLKSPVTFTQVDCPAINNCLAVGSAGGATSGTIQAFSASWNGGSWNTAVMPAGISGSEVSVFSGVSCMSATDCWAVGQVYDSSAAGYKAEVARWNGSDWQVSMLPNLSGAKNVVLQTISCPSATFCLAVGYQDTTAGAKREVAAKWNGTTWEYVTTPPIGNATYLVMGNVDCTAVANCYATGFYLEGQNQVVFANHWDGSTFMRENIYSYTGGGLTRLYGLHCLSGTATCVSGGSTSSGGTNVPAFGKTTGSGWTLTALPGVPLPTDKTSNFGAVACGSESLCEGVGSAEPSQGGVIPLAARLRADGVWERQTPPPLSEERAALNELSCVTTTYCVAIGTKNGYATSLPVAALYARVKPPQATTEAATAVKTTSATVNGSVNPNGNATSYYFEYGHTTAYGTKIPATPKEAGAGTSNVAVSEALTGLTESTSYHYRVVATNEGGTVYGNDRSFETEAAVTTPGELAGMAVTEPFNGGSSAISNFSTNWSTLGWANGASPKGSNTSEGWRPLDAWEAVNGAYYTPTVTDVGSGLAAVATMAKNPGNEKRWFSIWIDMQSPSGARAGYQLKFFRTAAGNYEVTLFKWVAGVQTELASKSGYSFANGSSFALADQGSTVSAWTNTGSGFSQLLSAGDSSFQGGNAGVDGSGNFTRLTNFKVGQLLTPVASMDAALKALPVNDPFSTSENPLSYSGAFAALAWDSSGSGHNTGWVSGGWGPYDAYSAINGAYWQKTGFADTGAGDAVETTLASGPGNNFPGRYFSLWLNMPNPGSTRSGYQLRFLQTSLNVYEVVLARWDSGHEAGLDSTTGYSFSPKSQLALVDKGGTVSAWTNTGSAFSQLLSASDSTYTSGFTGLEASGNASRQTEFRSGPLAPF